MKCPRRSCDFRGISLRLWQRLSSDFDSDYEILKTVSDYAPTHPPLVFPPLPCRKSPAPALAQSRPRSAWPTPWAAVRYPQAYAASARHAAQDGTKSRTWCSLPRLENDLCKPCAALAIAVLCAAYSVTALESPRNPIIYAGDKLYHRKINRLESR